MASYALLLSIGWDMGKGVRIALQLSGSSIGVLLVVIFLSKDPYYFQENSGSLVPTPMGEIVLLWGYGSIFFVAAGMMLLD